MIGENVIISTSVYIYVCVLCIHHCLISSSFCAVVHSTKVLTDPILYLFSFFFSCSFLINITITFPQYSGSLQWLHFPEFYNFFFLIFIITIRDRVQNYVQYSQNLILNLLHFQHSVCILSYGYTVRYLWK